MRPEVKALIDHFHLEKLPVEETLFASTWRSRQAFPNGNPHGTAMIGLFCDDPHSVSLFHKLPTDEIWHFYAGDPSRLILLYPDGSSTEVIMGSDPLNGQFVQYTVPAGVWQAGYVIGSGHYALYGCTMAPGFTSAGFEGGVRDQLLARYPQRVNDIMRLTNSAGDTRMPDGFAT